MRANLVKKIRSDFNFLKEKIKEGEIHSILVYGSYAKGDYTSNSDIDICLVAPKSKTIKKQARLLKLVWQNTSSDKYDVRIFEAMPIHIKMEIIKDHIVVLTKDLSELSYYFYFFRKLWQDQTVNWIE